MTEKSEPKNVECCEPESVMKSAKCCCQVDALVSIDGRGQIVLPKDVREKAKVKAGDKFVVISSSSDNDVCCLFLIKADDFGETVKGMLGPMMKGIIE